MVHSIYKSRGRAKLHLKSSFNSLALASCPGIESGEHKPYPLVNCFVLMGNDPFVVEFPIDSGDFH